jgi:CRP-like cAMP-binding protein
MHTGQVPSEVFVLQQGLVKIGATTTAGKQVLFAFRGPGDLVGELAAIDGEPRSATVVAIEKVDALVLGHEAFMALMRDQPSANVALLRSLSERMRDADAKRVQLATATAMARVSMCLLELCDRFGSEDGEIALPLSQDELASLAGASIESVGRALQQLRGLGWIETRRRGFRVVDRTALERSVA